MSPVVPGPRKVYKKSREQSEKALSTLFGDFPDCSRDFSGFWARRPRRHVRDLLGILGPKGKRDLCKGPAVIPKLKSAPCEVFGRGVLLKRGDSLWLK